MSFLGEDARTCVSVCLRGEGRSLSANSNQVPCVCPMKYCGLGFGSFLFLPGRMKRKYNAFSFLLGWELLPPSNTLTSCNLTGSHVPLWPTASILCTGSRAVKWAKSPCGRLFEAPSLLFQERMGYFPSLLPAAIWTRDPGSINNERPLTGGSATQLLCPRLGFQ